MSKRTDTEYQKAAKKVLQEHGKVTLSGLQRHTRASFAKSLELMIWLAETDQIEQDPRHIEFYQTVKSRLI